MRSRYFFLLVALVLVSWGVAAHAQQQITADIPFKFVAGDTEFGGGKCTFLRPLRSGGALMIQVHCGKALTDVGALPLTERGLTFKGGFKNEIGFRRYGDRYFLSELWIKNIGAQVNRSSKEDDAAKSGTEMKLVNLKVKSN